MIEQALAAMSGHSSRNPNFVESGCDAVTLGSGCLLPPLSSGGAQVYRRKPRRARPGAKILDASGDIGQ